MRYLASPELNPKYPFTEEDLEKALDVRVKYRNLIEQLLLSGFFLQAILAYQMARAFELIEIWIIDSVKT